MLTHSLEFHVDIPETVDLFKKIDQYAVVKKMNVMKKMKVGEEGTQVTLSPAVNNNNMHYKFRIWAYKNKDDIIEYEVAVDDNNQFASIKNMFDEM